MGLSIFLTIHIFLALFSLLFLVAGLLLFIFLIRSMVRGAPFVPTRPEITEEMIRLLEIRPGEKAVDLGSGDGRLVVALARAGAEAHGYEINPLLVWWSRSTIRKLGLRGRAFIHRKSFWGADLSGFNLVTLYGISYIMKGLEQKLQKELRPNARVVSNAFPFPGWPYERKQGPVYLYRRSTPLPGSPD